jgi:tRNA (cytidine/uridine-2'-O-)-methyltransferase
VNPPGPSAPTPPLHIALLEPEIPGNAGNVARLCAAIGAPLHLIGRLGFSFSHPRARRAAMDYWAQVEVHRHISFQDFLQVAGDAGVWAFTTRAQRTIWDATFRRGDFLLFGPESRGLPDSILQSLEPRTVRIPMVASARSLNLGTSVGVGAYECLRQLGGFAVEQP